MRTIKFNNNVYKIHPTYDLYAAAKDGNIINIIKRVPHKGRKKNNGYMMCNVRKHGQPGFKGYYVHRFIYECFNVIIPEGKVIDHINNKKDDNRLCNLQLMTPSENNKKSAKERDYTFVTQNHKNRKCVKATNKDTDEISHFNSLYAVQQHLGINAGIVKMVVEGRNNCKSGISKKDGCSYTFEYIKEEELPDNYKKSANIRPRRVTDEDKRKRDHEWRNKEYKCLKCSKVIKNGSKYIHNKKCSSQQYKKMTEKIMQNLTNNTHPLCVLKCC